MNRILAGGIALFASATLSHGQSVAPPDNAPVTIAELMQQGEGAERLGDLSRAVRIYRQILALAPAQRNVRYRLAFIAYQTGDWETARREMDAELSLGAPTPDSHNLSGAIDIQRRRFSEAEASFLKATALAPTLMTGWNNLAECRRITRDWPGAAAALDELLQLEPHNTYHRLRKELVELESGNKAQVMMRIIEYRGQSPYGPWVDALACAVALKSRDWLNASVEWRALTSRADPEFVNKVRSDMFFAECADASPEAAKFIRPQS